MDLVRIPPFRLSENKMDQPRIQHRDPRSTHLPSHPRVMANRLHGGRRLRGHLRVASQSTKAEGY
eukprot:7215931-Ditylum_brightwellii.AAC.1